MKNSFKPLNLEDEVVFVEASEKLFNDYPMFKISQFISQLKLVVQRHGNYAQSLTNRWFEEGVHGEVLKLGANGWQKGRFRIKVTLEFCPDLVEEITESNKLESSQSESPLDDIRRIVN